MSKLDFIDLEFSKLDSKHCRLQSLKTFLLTADMMFFPGFHFYGENQIQ
jgi:hypothetical protein